MQNLTIHEISVDISIFNSLINRAIFNGCSIVLYNESSPEKFAMEIAELAKRHADTVTVYKTLEGKVLFASDLHFNPYKVKVMAATFTENSQYAWEDLDEDAEASSDMMVGSVIEFEFEDKGVESADYFQGVGVFGTKFDEVFVGIGDNAHEAAEDAIEQLASSGHFVDEVLMNEITKESSEMSKDPVIMDDESNSDKFHYMALFVKFDPNDRKREERNLKSKGLASLDSKAQKKLDAIKEIVEEGQYAKIEGKVVDGTTANMLLMVINNISPENQAKFLAMPIVKMVDVGWKVTTQKTKASSESYKEYTRQSKYLRKPNRDEVVNGDTVPMDEDIAKLPVFTDMELFGARYHGVNQDFTMRPPKYFVMKSDDLDILVDTQGANYVRYAVLIDTDSSYAAADKTLPKAFYEGNTVDESEVIKAIKEAGQRVDDAEFETAFNEAYNNKGINVLYQGDGKYTVVKADYQDVIKESIKLELEAKFDLHPGAFFKEGDRFVTMIGHCGCHDTLMDSNGRKEWKHEHFNPELVAILNKYGAWAEPENAEAFQIHIESDKSEGIKMESLAASLFKYSELSDEAKKVAQKSYLDGWSETHPDDTFSDEELDRLCQDIEEEVLYNEDGTDNDAEACEVSERTILPEYMDTENNPKVEADARKRVLWQDKEHKSLDKAWKAAYIGMEVNQVDEYNQETEKYDERYMYSVTYNPGYPDNSGFKVILYGFADTANLAYKKAEEEFKKYSLEQMQTAKHVNPTYDKPDTLKPAKAGETEALHPDQKGGTEVKLHRIKDKHIDEIAKHANTGIVRHAILNPELSDLNKEQIASVRKALVEVGHRNMGHDRKKDEDDSGKGSVGSDIAEFASWLTSDCIGKMADYLMDSIGDRNAKDTYLFSKDKLEVCLIDFYHTEMKKANYEEIYGFWYDLAYNKKALAFTEDDDFSTFYFKEPLTEDEMSKLIKDIESNFKTEVAVVDGSAINVYHMSVNGIADVAQFIGQSNIIEIA